MSWSDEDRRRYAQRLQESRNVVARVYASLLIGAAILFIGFTIFVVVRRGLGSNSQGEHFYFGVFVLLVLGWIASRLLSLRPRRTQPLDVPPIRSGVSDVDGGKLFRLDVGNAPPAGRPVDSGDVRTFTFSRSFQGKVPIPSALAGQTPDEATLATAEAYRAGGRDWDYICDWINPAYSGWGSVQRKLYQKFIEALLDARRSGGATAG